MYKPGATLKFDDSDGEGGDEMYKPYDAATATEATDSNRPRTDTIMNIMKNESMGEQEYNPNGIVGDDVEVQHVPNQEGYNQDYNYNNGYGEETYNQEYIAPVE